MRNIGVQANLLPDSAIAAYPFPDGARSFVSLQVDCDGSAEISLLCKAGSAPALRRLAEVAAQAADELDRLTGQDGGAA